MEFQQLRNLQFLVAMISVSALVISPCLCVEYETLYTVCSQTQNAETCVQILSRDSRTSSASLPQLVLISIDLTSSQAKKNYGVFNKLIHNTTDAVLKGSYKKCKRVYGLISFKLVDAYALAKQRQYSKIHQLGEAKDAAYTCENSLPVDSSTAEMSEVMILTCETSASVISYLDTYVSLP